MSSGALYHLHLPILRMVEFIWRVLCTCVTDGEDSEDGEDECGEKHGELRRTSAIILCILGCLPVFSSPG